MAGLGHLRDDDLRAGNAGEILILKKKINKIIDLLPKYDTGQCAYDYDVCKGCDNVSNCGWARLYYCGQCKTLKQDYVWFQGGFSLTQDQGVCTDCIKQGKF